MNGKQSMVNTLQHGIEVKFRLKDEEMIQELNKIMQGDSAESDSTAQKKEKNQKENQDNKQ